MATTADRVLSRTTRATIDWASDQLRLSYEQIGNAVGATRRTIHRWRRSESIPSPRHQQSVEKLQQVRFLLRNTFRSEDDAQEWLRSPVPALHGRTPMSLLRQGDLDRLIEILSSLKSGNFV